MTVHDVDSLDRDFVPVRGTWVHTVEIDGEAVLLDEDENRLHHLNHTAALLWSCFDGQAAVGQLAAEIADELDLPLDAVLDDTLRVVRELGREGLLLGVRAERPEPA
jgi:hypothetical protein